MANGIPPDTDQAGGVTGGRDSAQSNCNLDESSVFDFETNTRMNTYKNRTIRPIQAQIRNVTHVNKSLNEKEIRVELARSKPGVKPGRFIVERKKNPAFLFNMWMIRVL